MISLKYPSLSRLAAGLFAVVLLFSAVTVFAQEQSGESAFLSDEERQRIEDLVATLESSVARQELIDNLKTLLEQQAAADQSALWEAVEWLSIDQRSQELADRYFTSLEDIGFSRGESGRLLIFLMIAIAVLFVVWVNKRLAGWFNRKLAPLRGKLKLSPKRFSLYFRIQSWFGYLLGGLFLLYILSRLPEEQFRWMHSHFTATTIAATLFSLLLIALLFASVWEIANFAMEYSAGRSHLSRARLDTLLPVIRNVLLVTLFILAMLVVLSELGVDIMPLLAGAGVLGIAIGFGAQTLVKEFINGFVVILEDLVSVGDVARLGDRVGVVEKISIRKIQLRDLDGTVSTVPFSEISIVDNLTKDYSYYLMDVGVAYRENVDEVMACLREVDKKLREDKVYGGAILEELEILGVNEFADSAVVIRCRTKTRAHDKWWVGREFNRRMKAAFDERGIEIPFPHQTLYFGEDKDGSAPAGRIRVVEEPAQNDDDTEENSERKHTAKQERQNEPTGEKKDSAEAEKRDQAEDNP